MAVSLELIKINSYFFSPFSCINMDCLKMHKLNCCYEIEIFAAATYIYSGVFYFVTLDHPC